MTTVPTSHTQQKAPSSVPALDSVRSWQACRESLLEITSPLKRGRAALHPRWQWDTISDDEHEPSSKLRNAFLVVEMTNDALRAAQGQGPEAVAQTRALVRNFFARMEAEATRGFDEVVPACRLQAVAVAVRETCEATAAMTTAAAMPTPANESKARREVSEAIGALITMLRSLAQRVWRSPVSA